MVTPVQWAGTCIQRGQLTPVGTGVHSVLSEQRLEASSCYEHEVPSCLHWVP